MSDLDRLGTKHKRLLAEIEALIPDLHEAMRAERQREPRPSQQEIMNRSGYSTLVTVRKILGEGDAPRGRPARKPATASD